MAATVRASIYIGAAEPSTGTSAETGLKFNREDTQSGTTPIAIPTAAGTAYSWIKHLALDVTATGDTSITNRTVARSSAPPAGILIHFKSTDVYAQASSATRPADSAVGDDQTPAGYTALTTTPQAYHANSVGTSSGRNGQFCETIIGVSSTATYVSGAGSAIAIPNLYLGYDES